MEELDVSTITNDGVSNVFMEDFLSHFPLVNFKGVFNSHNINSHFFENVSPGENFSLIVNILEDSNEGGHFVCIVGTQKAITYIDTFGLVCIDPSIQKFIQTCVKKHFKSDKCKVLFNDKTIQHEESNYCGLYCVLFIIYFDECCTYFKEKNHLNFHDKPAQLMKNDAKCVYYLKRIIKFFRH